MTGLYNLGLSLYHTGIKLAALWNPKARLWVKGRKDLAGQLENLPEGKKVWFHCASLGEFEQGRPVIEAFREKFPEYKIVLTFFSPSGYEQRKNYPGADFVSYLPLDTASNAEMFISKVAPEAVFFIKYEFWIHHLSQLFKKGIPVYLVSAIFRPGQLFFKPYGKFYLELLRGFRRIYVQDKASYKLLTEQGIEQVTVAGDTRFDRVLELAGKGSNSEIENLPSGGKVLVAGSTWEKDEDLIHKWWSQSGRVEGWRLIIAPHEISESHISNLQKSFPGAALYTEKFFSPLSEVVIIDTIGVLNKVYALGEVCYIGGGFGKGIHNTLEAAVYGKPVLFGPNYGKFREAVELIHQGGAFEVKDSEEMGNIMDRLSHDGNLKKAGEAAADYVRSNAGATQVILNSVEKEISF